MLAAHEALSAAARIRLEIRRCQRREGPFSKLLKRVAGGEPVIAKAGKPVARLAPCGPTGRKRRLGIQAGRMKVPDALEHFPIPWNRKML